MIYNWRTSYGGLEASEAKCLREFDFEGENRQPMMLVADLPLNKKALKSALQKMVGSTAKCVVVEHFEDVFKLSGRHASQLVGQHRSAQRHRSRKVDVPGLRKQLMEHAAE